MKFLILFSLSLTYNFLRVHCKESKRANRVSHVRSDSILFIMRPTNASGFSKDVESSKKVTIPRAIVTSMKMERTFSFVLVSLLSKNVVVDKRSNTSRRMGEFILYHHLSRLPTFAPEHSSNFDKFKLNDSNFQSTLILLISIFIVRAVFAQSICNFSLRNYLDLHLYYYSYEELVACMFLLIIACVDLYIYYTIITI